MRTCISKPIERPNNKNSNIFVERSDVLEDLIHDCDKTREYGGLQGGRGRKEKGLSESQKNIAREREITETNRALLETLAKKNMDKSIRIAAEKKDNRFAKLTADIDSSKELLETVDKSLDLFYETNRNKKRHQFEEWNANVHGSIQQKVSEKLNAMDSKELNRRKNEDYRKFLDITNRKSAIFLDIIIESEYDPLEPNTHTVKTSTGRLKDPTKVSAQKLESEGSMLGGGGPKASGGSGLAQREGSDRNGGKTKTHLKEMLPVETWSAGKIVATPYGAFAKLMDSAGSGAGSGPCHDIKMKLGRSHVVFDHYSFPTGKEINDSENPRGKRIFPCPQYANPSKVLDVPLDKKAEQFLKDIGPPTTKSWVMPPGEGGSS